MPGDPSLAPGLFDAMIDAGLPPLARLVFLFIYSRAFGETTPEGKPWGAPLSLSRIARAAGCSRSTVRRVLPVLEAAGFVVRRYRELRRRPVYFLGPAICKRK